MSLFKNTFLGLLLCIYSTVSALSFKQPDIDDGYGSRTFWSIDQDHNNYIWLATTHNVLKYDGYEFKAIELPEKSHFKKRTLHTDSSGKLWIGSEYGEVFSYHHGKVDSLGLLDGSTFTEKASTALQINQITSDKNNNIYFASNNGLYIKPSTHSTIQPLVWHNQIVRHVLITEQKIYATVSNKLYQLTGEALTPTAKELMTFSDQEIPRVLHQTQHHGIFIGSNQYLYHFNVEQNTVDVVNELPTNIIISMASDDQRLWVGTLMNGLYAIDWSKNNTLNYQHTPDKIGSISDNVITSLLLDESGVLFIATFDGDLSIFDTNSIAFGNYSEPLNHIACLQSKVIYHIFENDQQQLWLSTAKGVVSYSHSDQSCQHYGSVTADETTLSYPEIRSINQDKIEPHKYWVATNNGLNLLNEKIQQIDRLTNQVPAKPTLFSIEFATDIRLIGTESGLYHYDINDQQSTLITSSHQGLIEAEYFAYDFAEAGRVYFATTVGLAFLEGGQTHLVETVNTKLAKIELSDIYVNHDSIWVTTMEQGLYHFDKKFKLIKHYQLGKHFPANTQLSDILPGSSDELWVSSQNGLFRMKLTEQTIHAFYTPDGLQGNTFKRGASFKNQHGKLYFGGLNGLNGFHPFDIHTNTKPPTVVINQFNLFNREVIAGKEESGFLINQPINNLNQLNLSHNDYIFGFQFAALSFSDPMRNQYAYMLEGLDPDWNYTTAANRRVTYTNLDPGAYTFKVKATNKDGLWNHTAKTIAIQVKPAPWLSWWAYTAYVFLAVLFLYGFIKRKIHAEKTLSKRLAQQVESQTEKINQQNHSLTELMQKKDLLFANVSHEFRTPLTLILGPVDTLLKQAGMTENQEQLSIIKRNAKKLLNLVDQLLLLARFSETTALEQTSQNTRDAVQTLLASFEHAIQEKGLTINTENLLDAQISASDNALDIIMGNLLSNAIKYTPTGGQIDIESTINDQQLTLYVRDTGAGMTEAECATIFERFERLSQTQTIEGVGLGLALSQEVAQLNHSQVKVTSKPGHGSTFSVTFKLCKDDTKTIANLPEEKFPHQTSTTLKSFDNHHDKHHDENKETVLIIEDNADMRHHLKCILSAQFNTMEAVDGKKGLALAIETIPDIILCDVMMPQMDGFEVSRMIRSNPLTSHIPLVLLTALDESASRIKGWRENVDQYLTKPFDAKELLLQLKNILNIRKIISKNVQESVINNTHYSDLCEVDQTFITKLKESIETHYHQPDFGLTEMAKFMFKSERHLQRKSKALIGLSPTELLREYRLNQGAKTLLMGHSVNATSDQCGFNSVTYFASSFKKKFGHSPKQYQNLHKEQSNPNN